MIKACDFLSFAENMKRNNEADDRVCIGRCYYASIHIALDAARKQGYEHDSKDAGGMHSNLIFHFERRESEDSGVVADLLRKLKRSRKNADYELSRNIYSDVAVTALKHAKTIFDTLK